MNKNREILSKNATGIYDPIRAQAIKWTAEKHKVTKEYVRNALNKTSTGGRTEDILKDYRAKYAELKKVLS